MRTYQRDIFICILAILATVLAVWCFLGNMTNEKKAIQTDLYALLDTTTSGVLVINRPATFSHMILSQKGLRELFTPFIPDVYLSLIQQNPSLSTVIFSFHKQGVVMYTKADKRSVFSMNKHIFQKRFNTYSPQVKRKNEITFTYYPDAKNRYFGFYQHGNILVASYSKHLLENVAERQLCSHFSANDDLKTLLRTLDHNVPLHVIVPADTLDLYVSANDSTTWKIQDQWLTADIQAEKGRICCIGSLPYHAQIDSLYAPLSDTLTIRLQKRFPSLQIAGQPDIGTEVVYFTTCGTSTTSPSYE